MYVGNNLRTFFVFQIRFPAIKKNPNWTNIEVSKIKRLSKCVRNDVPTIFQHSFIDFDRYLVIVCRDWYTSFEIDRIHKSGSVITEGRVDGNLNLTRSLGDLKYKHREHLTPEEQAITANPDTYIFDLDN